MAKYLGRLVGYNKDAVAAGSRPTYGIDTAPAAGQKSIARLIGYGPSADITDKRPIYGALFCEDVSENRYPARLIGYGPSADITDKRPVYGVQFCITGGGIVTTCCPGKGISTNLNAKVEFISNVTGDISCFAGDITLAWNAIQQWWEGTGPEDCPPGHHIDLRFYCDSSDSFFGIDGSLTMPGGSDCSSATVVPPLASSHPSSLTCDPLEIIWNTVNVTIYKMPSPCSYNFGTVKITITELPASPAPLMASAIPEEPCPHLGKNTGEVLPCSCPSGKAEVYRCALHTICTKTAQVLQVPVCRLCQDNPKNKRLIITS